MSQISGLLRPHEHRWPKGPGRVQAEVARLYNVTLDDMRASTRRGARAAFARQVAMYLMHVVYRLSLAEAAGHFGRDRSTALHACRHVEDLRDDDHFDRELLDLENILLEAADMEVAG